MDGMQNDLSGMQTDLSQKIDNLQYSISKLTNLNTVQDKGRFPSQPHQKPKGIHEVEAQEGESSIVKEVETVVTLRSGKEVDLPTSKLQHKEELQENRKKLLRADAIPLLFPRLLCQIKWLTTQAQHTAILRQIQHHLGITSAPEHAIPSSSEPSQAPPFVDQPISSTH
ncbi:hypothetical protein CK203_055360 [Vitis vinifera]|uniref:Uncharacterized protein n=1 Tax=Vitis vinifera TaxID=29760 RepID=A0A438GSX6_VITVI|nr:hypothetical protein CK203_055360 [Vitis vinifera]